MKRGPAEKLRGGRGRQATKTGGREVSFIDAVLQTVAAEAAANGDRDAAPGAVDSSPSGDDELASRTERLHTASSSRTAGDPNPWQ